jgi:hypothetical protein
MLAACPIRTETIQKVDTSSIMIESNIVKPSHRAFLDAGARGVISTQPIMKYTDQVEVPPVVLENHFRGVAGHEPSGTQFDYIDMVMDLVKYFVAKSLIVSGPWLFEIVRCCKVLREERETLRRQYPSSHTTQWASTWPFQIPEYRSRNVVNQPDCE